MLIVDTLLDGIYYIVIIAVIGFVNLACRYICQLTGIQGLENAYLMRFIETVEFLLAVAAILSLAVSTITRLISDLLYPSYSSMANFKVTRIPPESKDNIIVDDKKEQQKSKMKENTQKEK